MAWHLDPRLAHEPPGTPAVPVALTELELLAVIRSVPPDVCWCGVNFGVALHRKLAAGLVAHAQQARLEADREALRAVARADQAATDAAPAPDPAGEAPRALP